MDYEASRSQSAQLPLVKVPKTKAENRQYKEGFVDDNNEHLSYFHFRIVWPTLAFTVVIYAVLIGGVLGSLATDDLPNAKELRKAFWTRYGALRFRCNSTVPFPKDGLPSVLNLFELNVFGNLMFRICACIPIAIRLFVVHCRSYDAYMICFRLTLLTALFRLTLASGFVNISDFPRLRRRELIRADFLSSSFVHNMMNEVIWALSFVEVFAMGLFSIITIRKDSTALHRYCKVTFAMTAAVNMLVTTAVIFAYKRNSTKRLDIISFILKLLSTAVFCYVAPQYFQRNHANISFQMCHSYLPRVFAIMEYAMIISYGAFHLSSLIDVRHVSFLCYPRTCSGECEPLDPDNFAKGGKYEHCRAFEYNQLKVFSEREVAHL